LKLLGTLGTGQNLHEGRGGWTAKMYVENASSSSFANAFFNPDTETFDFAYYMARQGYNGVDCVFLQLGINDVFAAQPINIDDAVNVFVDNMQAIVGSIHAYSPEIKVVINLVIPCGTDQDAFTGYYNLSQTAWQCKKNTFEANLALLDAFSGKQNVFLSPFNAAIDCVNNLPNDVHPNIEGYNQLGTQMYSYMRAIN
jgi:lysophospholipase L1-like esterase